MSTNTRFYEIDLLRFISAFFVLVFHYTYTGYMEGFSTIANFESVRNYSRYAYMGINFFFVISGFVIFMSIEKGSARQFLLSRFIRLFPAYWTALCLTTLLTLVIGANVFTVTPWQFITNIIMVNELLNEKAIDSAYWTLFIELQFYVVVYILLLFGLIKYFQHIIFVILIASLLALYLPIAQADSMWTEIFPHWSGYFACGGVFYLLKRDGINFYRLFLLIVSFLYVLKQSTLFGQLMSHWFKIEFNLYVIALINSVFFTYFCITTFCKGHFMRQRWCYYFGVLTYPLYLVHQHIGYMIFNAFGTVDNIGYLVAATITLMLMLAWLIHRYIEVKLAINFKRVGCKILGINSRYRRHLNNI
ncbi:MAG: peptidoglycan/LPS O-acetylase OafA/YrhL [Alteromonadaceae bacterium]|jgi:peptidoglycan/LPS O-acetylase OafA/YrhL